MNDRTLEAPSRASSCWSRPGRLYLLVVWSSQEPASSPTRSRVGRAGSSQALRPHVLPILKDCRPARGERHQLLHLAGVKPDDRRVARLFRPPLTVPRQFDILQPGPGWRGPNALRSIKTARVHHAARRRGGRVAARGASAAADDADDRLSTSRRARGGRAGRGRISPRPE